MASLLTAYALTLAFFLALPWSRRRNRELRTDEKRTHRTSIALGIVHLSGLVVPLAAVAWRLGGPGPPWLGWAAVCGMVAALMLQLWSQRSLGEYFTLALQSRRDQPLCRNGPYRWLRHPAYLAQIIFWTGLALSSRSIAAASIVGFIAIGGYAYRIRAEEAMLLETLDAKYRDYAAVTKRLIPLLW
jgi:protein-S-isoprenylcysteine O-methyltransferase Ste14